MSASSNELPGNCKFILNQHIPIDELLGSVTTYNNIDGSDSKNMQVRASARVFKKMKLDSTPAQAVSSPVVEKKEIKEEPKPEVKKPFRPLWEHEDKNLFFEALNEYGKDFDAIHLYISGKLKKKGVPDSMLKTREQIRHLYYRTWHKISKYLKFSDEVKKMVQELYGLINYGELRKKLSMVCEKSYVKLNELIYRGFVTIKIKGKTIRIRTPMCRALRSLNQFDERNSDLKLPLKVQVELIPKDMINWMKVQMLSQNPRVRTTLPLQKRLSTLITCMSEKWKSPEIAQYENAMKQLEQIDEASNKEYKATSPLLRLCPPASCNIEVPILNLSEYMTCQNICLNSYEERLGVKVRGEQLWLTSLSGSSRAILKKSSLKRHRNESNSDKMLQSQKNVQTEKAEESIDFGSHQTVSEVVDEVVNTILALKQDHPEEKEQTDIKVEIEEAKHDVRNYEDEILKHKNGWTIENCGTLCIGDLYLMYGSDAKLTLEYSWDEPKIKKEEMEESTDDKRNETDVPYDNNNKINVNTDLSNTLKRLLSVAKLHYRKNRIQCPCGHVCGTPKPSTSKSKSIPKNVQVGTNKERLNNNANKPTTIEPEKETVVVHGEQIIRRLSPSVLFRRPSSPNDLLKAQLDSIQRLRPRYCNRRGRRPRTKPVIVERKLPILANRAENGRQIVQMSIISQDNIPTTPRPIAPKLTGNIAGIDQGNATNVCSNLPSNGGYAEQNFKIISMESDMIQIDRGVVQTNMIPIETEMINDPANIISDNATTPSRVNSPTGITNLIEMALTNNENNANGTGLDNKDEAIMSFVGNFALGLLPQGVSSVTPPTSPSRVLKENENQWLNSEVADFSLSSFLGQLESPIKTTQPAGCDQDSRMGLTQEVQSLLAENSLDYAAKFADLAAQVILEPKTDN